jgi:hypothetical protein
VTVLLTTSSESCFNYHGHSSSTARSIPIAEGNIVPDDIYLTATAVQDVEVRPGDSTTP